MLLQVEGMAVKHMRSTIKDPQLQQQLTPKYALGCKRILASDDYYPALATDNVQLVPAGLGQVCVHSFMCCTCVLYMCAGWVGRFRVSKKHAAAA